MDRARIKGGRRKAFRRLNFSEWLGLPQLKLHPLFLAVGVWYCCTGELFLFLMSCLVAIEHECAHAFAAAKLGYHLNKIVLMPFGAVIDGDLSDISIKDEIFVAICGPLCNLCTAVFFVAWWWLTPTVYAFTDTACYSSLTIALANLLPAYPLDGGRVLRCALTRALCKNGAKEGRAEKQAESICRIVTFLFSAGFFALFALSPKNLSLLLFGGFLFLGAVGNKERSAYIRMDFSCKDALKKGMELKRVAVLGSCAIKDVTGFLSRGSYLVLEVYDESERHLFDVPQNELALWFLRAKTPYDSLISIKNAIK